MLLFPITCHPTPTIIWFFILILFIVCSYCGHIFSHISWVVCGWCSYSSSVACFPFGSTLIFDHHWTRISATAAKIDQLSRKLRKDLPSVPPELRTQEIAGQQHLWEQLLLFEKGNPLQLVHQHEIVERVFFVYRQYLLCFSKYPTYGRVLLVKITKFIY